MEFSPIITMNVILVVLTILLAIADKLLVSYGECRIGVKQGGERKEFIVKGGGTLLSALIENKIQISSSCAGRGTCGYCKVCVIKGGGPMLPTEEIFMSRHEKHENMRLACQVKVKEDLEIVILDYLLIVREMVKNKKFDPKKRWVFTIN
ncbi:MAG: 2Fe-2S iron-sulfur cluster-binding protein [bacterium]